MNVMMLAAGQGSRLNPYTLLVPKPAIPFLNVPLAAHALSFIEPVKINKMVVNTHHLSEKIHTLFQSFPKISNSFHFSDEKELLLGSGGGLKKAEAILAGDDLILINADEVILPKNDKVILEAISDHQSSSSIATLLVMEHPEVGVKFGGVWCNEKNEILGFGKAPIEGATKAYHFIGVQVLSEKIFSFLEPDVESNILYDGVMKALASGHTARVKPIECTWFETGNIEDFLGALKSCLDYLAGSESFQKTKLEKTLKKFSSEPYRLIKNSDTLSLVSESAQVAVASLHGHNCLGPGSIVGSTSNIEDVVTSRDTEIKPGDTIKCTIVI